MGSELGFGAVFPGMISGFMGEHNRLRDQAREDDDAQHAREQKVYEALINSPDPEIQAHAVAGLLDSAGPRKSKGGIRGWLGETAQSPHLPAIKALINSPVTKQEPNTTLPSEQTSGYLSDVQPGSTPSLAQADSSPTEVGAPPPATISPLPAPSLITRPSPGIVTGGTHAVTGPRQAFRTPEQTAAAASRGKAQGDVEGEVAGLMSAGATEAEARAAVLAKLRGRGASAGTIQSIAGEAPDNSGTYVPAFGVFDREAGSPTFGQYVHPTTKAPIPGFRPKAAAQASGTANNDTALRLFNKPYAQLTPAERTKVEEEGIRVTAATAGARTTATAAATNDAALDKPIGVANALRYPGVSASTTLRQLGAKVPISQQDQDKIKSVSTLEGTLGEVEGLLPKVFPQVAPGILGALKTGFSLAVQSAGRQEDYTKLHAAIASTMAGIVRANGVTQRLNQKELDLAQQQMIDLSALHGDTLQSAQAKLEILRDLIRRVNLPVAAAGVGAPPPGPAAGAATAASASTVTMRDARGVDHVFPTQAAAEAFEQAVTQAGGTVTRVPPTATAGPPVRPNPASTGAVGAAPPAPATTTTPQASATSHTISPSGLAALKAREGGFVDTAYPDAGGTAIGYGMQTWKGQKVTPGLTITQADADAEMVRQITETYAPVVDKALTVPVTQAQYDALISLAWNAPTAARAIIAKLNAGQKLTVKDFQRSATSQGKPSEGLSTRRQAEFAPFQ